MSRVSRKSRKSDIFPFLSLPAELRLKIYSHVCDHGFMAVPPRGRARSIAAFANAFHLARLCRQIRDEALPHVFARAVLIIDWSSLHADVYKNLPAAAACAITAIRIVSFPMDHGKIGTQHKQHKTRPPISSTPDAADLCPWSLMEFFPSLRQLRIVLRPGECISRRPASDAWDWGHEAFTPDAVMQLPGVDWICRNQGLRSFTFKARTLCGDCDWVGGARQVLREVGRLMKADVEQL